jgi:hypothetical protein
MGPKGNVEFLAWMEYPGLDQASPIEIDLELLTNPETTT